MDHDKLYTIGEVSKLCHISAKTLRFYDKIGMIVPDKISESGYRYYSLDTILSIPVIKYYKQMGFRLEEMQELVNGNGYCEVEGGCNKKIGELWQQVQSIHDSYLSVKEWYELLQEAKAVRYNNIQEVSVRYITGEDLCYMDQEFHYQYKEAIINIPWVNYLDSISNEITGPVILGFEDWREKMNGRSTQVRIMQKPIRPVENGISHMAYGGCMAATLYHVGSLENLEKSYRKIEQWEKDKGIVCGPHVYERYVVDYWTTKNEDEFVTELIVPLA